MKKIVVLTFVFLVFAPFLIALNQNRESTHAALEITGGYLRAKPPGQLVTAGFLSISNLSDQDCSILSAESSLTDRVEFHEHMHLDGMMKMRRKAYIKVDAGETIHFRPGGLHMMFFELEMELKEDEVEKIVLSTDQCGSHIVPLTITSLFATGLKEYH